MPRVSVNICCYNGERYIAEAIKSVLAQTFGDFEIVVINDGSQDGTEREVLALKDDRIRYFAQENQGLSASRNRAIALSRGEYIAILDQDDLWEPKKLEQQVALFEKTLGVGVVYSDAYVIDDTGKIQGIGIKKKYRRGKVSPSLIRGNYIYCPTVMFRASVLKSTDGFRTDLKIAEEYELYLRLSQLCEFDFIDEPLAKYRVHSGNTSRNLINDFPEYILSLTEFAAASTDKRLCALALRRANLGRLTLAAALIWAGKGASAKDVLSEMSPALIPGSLAYGLIFASRLPCWLARLVLFPARIAGLIK